MGGAEAKTRSFAFAGAVKSVEFPPFTLKVNVTSKAFGLVTCQVVPWSEQTNAKLSAAMVCLVEVGVGVKVSVGWPVLVGVAVSEGMDVTVGVNVATGVLVAVGVKIVVGVKVAVGVNVAVGVKVIVGVAVAPQL